MLFPLDLYSATVFDSHIPYRAHATLKVTSLGQGTALQGTAWDMRINIGHLSTACRRPAQVWLFWQLCGGHSRRLLTRMLLAFWDVFSCSDDDGDSRLYGK